MCVFVCMYVTALYVKRELYVSVCIGGGSRGQGWRGWGRGWLREDSSVSYLSTERDLQFQVR